MAYLPESQLGLDEELEKYNLEDQHLQEAYHFRSVRTLVNPSVESLGFIKSEAAKNLRTKSPLDFLAEASIEEDGRKGIPVPLSRWTTHVSEGKERVTVVNGPSGQSIRLHKGNGKLPAFDLSKPFAKKCRNRECNNLGGQIGKPRSIYCSKRCQSREQNLRQGRIKNVHVRTPTPTNTNNGGAMRKSLSPQSSPSPPVAATSPTPPISASSPLPFPIISPIPIASPSLIPSPSPAHMGIAPSPIPLSMTPTNGLSSPSPTSLGAFSPIPMTASIPTIYLPKPSPATPGMNNNTISMSRPAPMSVAAIPSQKPMESLKLAPILRGS